MRRIKVLLVCHNHPDILVGGVEIYTRDLLEEFRRSPRVEPVLLARAGRPYTEAPNPHPDSPIAMINRNRDEYLMYTEFGDFDHFFGRLRRRTGLSTDFTHFVRSVRPDVVHFQHTAYLGYDIVRITRNALPGVPIVYSLHEYLPICHRDGQMVRTKDSELCKEESPRRCHECFPEISPQGFYMRKRFIQSHLSLVDQFIAPSEYVLERYADWGIPRSKIQVEPQGFVSEDAMTLGAEPEARSRNRFAYFGQLTPYKGADVLLEALEILGDAFDGHLWIFGANLD